MPLLSTRTQFAWRCPETNETQTKLECSWEDLFETETRWNDIVDLFIYLLTLRTPRLTRFLDVQTTPLLYELINFRRSSRASKKLIKVCGLEWRRVECEDEEVLKDFLSFADHPDVIIFTFLSSVNRVSNQQSSLRFTRRFTYIKIELFKLDRYTKIFYCKSP